MATKTASKKKTATKAEVPVTAVESVPEQAMKILLFARNRTGYDEDGKAIYSDNRVDDAVNRIKVALYEEYHVIQVNANGSRNVGFLVRVLEFMKFKNLEELTLRLDHVKLKKREFDSLNASVFIRKADFV